MNDYIGNGGNGYNVAKRSNGKEKGERKGERNGGNSKSRSRCYIDKKRRAAKKERSRRR